MDQIPEPVIVEASEDDRLNERCEKEAQELALLIIDCFKASKGIAFFQSPDHLDDTSLPKSR